MDGEVYKVRIRSPLAQRFPAILGETYGLPQNGNRQHLHNQQDPPRHESRRLPQRYNRRVIAQRRPRPPAARLGVILEGEI